MSQSPKTVPNPADIESVRRSGDRADAPSAPAGRFTLRSLRPLVRLAVGFAGLYLCLITVHILAVASEPVDPTVSIDPHPAVLESRTVRISGTAPPGSRVEFLAASGFPINTRVSPAGRFSTIVDLPPRTTEVVVSIRDEFTGEMLHASVHRFSFAKAVIPPALRMARHIPGRALDWLAGTADSHALIRIQALDGSPVADVRADENGVFDVLVLRPLKGRVAYVARPLDLAEVEPERRSEATYIYPRRQLAPQWDEALLGTADTLAVAGDSLPPLGRDLLVSTSSDTTRLLSTVVLPSEHPYLDALARGQLSPGEFVYRTTGLEWFTWGGLRGEVSSLLTSESETRITAEAVLPFVPERLEVGDATSWEPQIQTANNEGRSVHGSGIGSLAFASPRDRLTVVARDRDPRLSTGPLPSRMAGDTLVWVGGQSVSRALLVSFASPLYRELEAARGNTSLPVKRDESSRRGSREEFLHWFRIRAILSFVVGAINALLYLIPFGAVVWLYHRRPQGWPEAWRSLAAAAVVFGIWRCWNYLLTLSGSGADLWLRGVVDPMQRALGLGSWSPYDGLPRGTNLAEVEILAFNVPPNSVYSQIFSADENVFLLLFVSAIVSAPLYFSAAAELAAGEWRQQPPPRRWERLRRTLAVGWVALRALYGAAVLALGYLLSLGLESLAREREDPAVMQSPLLELPREMARSLSDLIDLTDRRGVALLTVFVAVMFLLTFGLRAALYGLGLLLIALYAASDDRSFSWFSDEPGLSFVGPGLQQMVPVLSALADVPWPLVLAAVGLLSFPLVLRLVELYIPARGARRYGWLLAATLLSLTLLLPRIAPVALIIVGASFIVAGFGWVAARLLAHVAPAKQVAVWISRNPRGYAVVALLVALVFALPAERVDSPYSFAILLGFIAKIDALYVYLLVAGLAGLLYRYTERGLTGGDREFHRRAAVVVFAAFVVNSSAHWIFIPVPFLVALLLARYWLLRPSDQVDRVITAVAQRGNQRSLIQDVLDEVRVRQHLEAVQKELTNQLHKASLAPDEYERRVEEVRAHYQEELHLEELAPGVSSREAVFAVGEMSPTANARHALEFGLLLAFLPITLALYQYNPIRSGSDPFPFAALLMLLLTVLAGWLLYVLFLGYYFHDIRGRSGLGKGIALSVAIILPSLVLRLLETPSLEAIRPVLVWSLQVFTFCSLVGLLMDYAALKRHGFGLRDLRLVHNLPVLSVYGSSLVAAAISTIITLFQGGLAEVLKVVVDTVIRGPTSGIS